MATAHLHRRHRFPAQTLCSSITDTVVLDINTNQLATEQGCRIPGKLLSPGSLIDETTVTGIFRDTQNAIHSQDFPGWRCETSDASAEATALREAQEEVGLEASQVDILGCLPEYSTATGFTITPVVALVTPPLNLKLDDFEVADVFEVPFAFLMDSGNHQQHQVEFQGALRAYYAMPWEGYFIWGATAGMLVTLQRFLFATDDA